MNRRAVPGEFGPADRKVQTPKMRSPSSARHPVGVNGYIVSKPNGSPRQRSINYAWRNPAPTLGIMSPGEYAASLAALIGVTQRSRRGARGG